MSKKIRPQMVVEVGDGQWWMTGGGGSVADSVGGHSDNGQVIPPPFLSIVWCFTKWGPETWFGASKFGRPNFFQTNLKKPRGTNWSTSWPVQWNVLSKIRRILNGNFVQHNKLHMASQSTRLRSIHNPGSLFTSTVPQDPRTTHSSSLNHPTTISVLYVINPIIFSS